MAIEEQLLTAAIRNTLKEADEVLQQLFNLGPRSLAEAEGPSEEFEQADHFLRFYVEKAFRDVGILAERLGLPLLRKQLDSEKSKFKDLTEKDVFQDAMTYYSPPLEAVRNYFDSLSSMTLGREITGLGVFENILQNAGKITKQLKVEPNNEKKVRECLHTALSFAFPDVVREIPLPKNLKTYHPDLGVRSLMAAVEVKFVTSKKEAASVMGGIYDDMKGYSGHYEWRSFYAVIYMTDAFYTQKDVEREWQLVKADLNWTPIVVFGAGQRAKKG